MNKIILFLILLTVILFVDFTISYADTSVSKLFELDNYVIETIFVATNPWGITYDSVNQYMYFVNHDSRTVSVIDTSTNAIIDVKNDNAGNTIPVETHPFQIAYDSANKRMYVTNYNSHTVSVIDTSTNSVIGSPIPVENGPRVIAYDSVNEHMYVVNTRNSTVSVIDTSTNSVIGSPIPIGNLAYGIAYDSVNERMYVTNYGSHTVSVIDTSIQNTEKSDIAEINISQSKNNGGSCLIATATYGSELAPQVQMLREIRDNQLMNTESGTTFMSGFNELYYTFSPTIADMERESPVFKEIVKAGLTPMLSTLRIMESAETESEVLGLGLAVLTLNLGMYLGLPVIVIVGMIKRF